MSDYFVWDLEPAIVKFTIPLIDAHMQLRYYGIIFATMILGGYYLWRWQMGRAKYNEEEMSAWFFIGLFCVVAGSRLGHTLFYEWHYFSRHPLEILYFWKGGLASHGATIGLIVGLIGYSRWYKIPTFEVMDCMAFPAALGATMVRLGNFFNSEIVGRVTDVPWAVRFTHYRDHGEYPRHPSQLYEVFLGLIVLGVLYLVDRHYGAKRPKGVMGATFLIVYFIGRFTVEFFKEYQSLTHDESLLTMGQWLSIPFVLIGIAWMTYALRKGPEEPYGWIRQEQKDREILKKTQASTKAPKKKKKSRK